MSPERSSPRATSASSGTETSRPNNYLIQPDAARAGLTGHVNGVAKADVVGVQSHDERMGAVAVAEEADALEQVAGGNATSGEDDLLAGSEVIGAINAMRIVDAHTLHAALQFGVVDHQAADHFAVQAAHGGCGNDAFGRAADSHHGMDSRATNGCRDSSRQIAVANQAYARAGFSNGSD